MKSKLRTQKRRNNVESNTNCTLTQSTETLATYPTDTLEEERIAPPPVPSPYITARRQVSVDDTLAQHARRKREKIS
jgi:hypothetical protein